MQLRALAVVLGLALVANVGPAAGRLARAQASSGAQAPKLARIQLSQDRSHFVREGSNERVLVWGVNYDHDDAGRLLEDYWADEWATVVDDFREMKALGAKVIRIHLQVARFMDNVDQPNGENLARLAQLVKLAEETGLYLDVTGLGCYHKKDVPAWYRALDEAARWEVQARFWKAVAGACKESSAIIFCYDLMNEPILDGGDDKKDWLPGEGLAGKHFVQRITTDLKGRTDKEVAGAWVAKLTAAIRSVDDRPMITVGEIPWAQIFKGARPLFHSPEVGKPLDFVSIHLYPKASKLDDDLEALKAYKVGKPLVVEEIFPLSAGFEETEAFMDRANPLVDGWVSFYWGKTIEEYEKTSDLKSALIGGWLKRFRARAPQHPPAENKPEKIGLKLGAPFGDHMVVQRDRPIRVWGEAGPGLVIEVRLGSRRVETKAGPAGQWEATLDPMPAGGPHALRASVGDVSVEAADVLIGDVWLCSGQSNMQMTLKESDGGLAAADAVGTPRRLRFCSVGRKASANPETKGDIHWREASPAVSREFSAVGFYFASGLLSDRALDGVPIGVIDSSFGGSMCEAWIPKEALSAFDPKDLRASLFGVAPSGFYNAMIAPLGRAPIRGVVWYQGEGNAGRPESYPRLLGALIASWRERFETPHLPFIVIQLPDWAAGADGMSWAWIRDAQAAAVRATPHTSLAVGINTTDGFDLHPRQKAELGRRAAFLALRNVYNRPIIANGPVFREAKAEGNALRVTFDTAGGELVSRGGGPIRGFAIAGADGKYRYADATIEGEAVVLRSEGVPAPKTVRYAWAGVPEATLANRLGLPAAPFRTDDLSAPDADLHKQPVTRHIRMKAYEATIDGAGSVTSLGIGGKQFLSNELGGAGGTGVPGWFGFRNLADIRDLGPGLVSCGDNEVTVLLRFGEKEMEWEVTNQSKGELRFRVALAPHVAVKGQAGSGPLTLTRGSASLTLTGVDTMTTSDDGRILEMAISGQGTKRLVLTVGGD